MALKSLEFYKLPATCLSDLGIVGDTFSYEFILMGIKLDSDIGTLSCCVDLGHFPTIPNSLTHHSQGVVCMPISVVEISSGGANTELLS